MKGATPADEPVLAVEDLAIEFSTAQGPIRAVDGLDFAVHAGEIVGVVGESGSGKSVTGLSLLGLLPAAARVVSGRAWLVGTDLLALRARSFRQLRGNQIAMVFQDPMTSLNPVMRVGRQIAESVQLHQGLSRSAAHQRAVELLELVGIPQAAQRAAQYPHELSGGMRQRVMIAIAIANEPTLLIADEPTTALDVTIQAQILQVLKSAVEQTGAATILITHDLGVVAEMADRVLVMYAGRIVERGDVRTVFHQPAHPYTKALLSSRPRVEVDVEQLEAIPGSPPPPRSSSVGARGCSFAPRCDWSKGRFECRDHDPAMRELATAGHLAACHFAEEVVAAPRVGVPSSASPTTRNRATQEQT